MNLDELKLPSNRNFGLFFTGIAFLLTLFAWLSGWSLSVYVLATLTFTLLIVTLLAPNLLISLNRFWMRLGLILGAIVSPITLGIIFFMIFTPTALFFRLIGRDELQLRKTEKKSYWIARAEPLAPDSFKDQY